MKPSSRPRFHGPLEALQKGLRATKIRLAVLDASSQGKAQRTAAQTGGNCCRHATDKRYRLPGTAYGVCLASVYRRRPNRTYRDSDGGRSWL